MELPWPGNLENVIMRGNRRKGIFWDDGEDSGVYGERNCRSLQPERSNDR